MSNLEKAIVAIVEVFEEFAGTDEQNYQLTNTKLGQLIKAQLANPEFKNKVDPDNIKDVMEKLDKNRDGELNFNEFSQFIADLARAHYKRKKDMSNLEKAILAIVEVFEEYAGTDEQNYQLTNAKLGQLIKTQLANPEFKDKVDPENIKDVMEILDKNRDEEVNFNEFSQCIAGLARAHFTKKYGKKQWMRVERP